MQRYLYSKKITEHFILLWFCHWKFLFYNNFVFHIHIDEINQYCWPSCCVCIHLNQQIFVINVVQNIWTIHGHGLESAYIRNDGETKARQVWHGQLPLRIIIIATSSHKIYCKYFINVMNFNGIHISCLLLLLFFSAAGWPNIVPHIHISLKWNMWNFKQFLIVLIDNYRYVFIPASCNRWSCIIRISVFPIEIIMIITLINILEIKFT